MYSICKEQFVRSLPSSLSSQGLTLLLVCLSSLWKRKKPITFDVGSFRGLPASPVCLTVTCFRVVKTADLHPFPSVAAHLRSSDRILTPAASFCPRLPYPSETPSAALMGDMGLSTCLPPISPIAGGFSQLPSSDADNSALSRQLALGFHGGGGPASPGRAS